MSYYIGTSPQDVLDGFIKRYMYGLRRNEDGELYLIRIDQLSGDVGATINDLGVAAENFLDFEEGIDSLEGIDETHDKVNDNLRYPQIRWDGRSLQYFIDPSDGQFIQRISQAYTTPDNISSPGYGDIPENQVIK